MWKYMFLDDERLPTGNNYGLHWIIVRNVNNAIEYVQSYGLPKGIYFDHDLGFRQLTGYDFAHWLVNYCLDRSIDVPPYYIHSMNPVGENNIRQLFNSYRKQRIIPNILSKQHITIAEAIRDQLFEEGLIQSLNGGSRYLSSVRPVMKNMMNNEAEYDLFVFDDTSELYFSTFYSEWIVDRVR